MVSQAAFKQVYDLADHTARMIAKFINSYKLKGRKGQKYKDQANTKLVTFEQYIQQSIPERYRQK